MTTPAYGLKHWWRAERSEGESLKSFARQYAGKTRGGYTTSGEWLRRKGKNVDAIIERKEQEWRRQNGIEETDEHD